MLAMLDDGIFCIGCMRLCVLYWLCWAMVDCGRQTKKGGWGGIYYWLYDCMTAVGGWIMVRTGQPLIGNGVEAASGERASPIQN